jgi:hypothetical protein
MEFFKGQVTHSTEGWVWLKWQHTCLACGRSSVQSLALQNFVLKNSKGDKLRHIKCHDSSADSAPERWVPLSSWPGKSTGWIVPLRTVACSEKPDSFSHLLHGHCSSSGLNHRPLTFTSLSPIFLFCSLDCQHGFWVAHLMTFWQPLHCPATSCLDSDAQCCSDKLGKVCRVSGPHKLLLWQGWEY